MSIYFIICGLYRFFVNFVRLKLKLYGQTIRTINPGLPHQRGAESLYKLRHLYGHLPCCRILQIQSKNIVNIVQSQDDAQIEELLKGEQIWYCGECMSCVTRCPRRNAPGLVVMALRSLSIDLGYFVESEKGRQMLPLTRRMQSNILNYGYCVYPRTFLYKDHPEYGLTGKWLNENMEEVYERLGANLDGKGPGILRKIPDESLAELKAIFDETGATRRMEIIEEASKLKAKEMGIPTTNMKGRHLRIPKGPSQPLTLKQHQNDISGKTENMVGLSERNSDDHWFYVRSCIRQGFFRDRKWHFSTYAVTNSAKIFRDGAPYHLRRHCIPCRSSAAGDHDDNYSPPICFDGRTWLQKLRMFLHHIIWSLYRSVGGLEDFSDLEEKFGNTSGSPADAN